jgi:plastocyanin
MKNSAWLVISCVTGAAAIAACSSSTTTGGTQATSDGGTGGQVSTSSASTTSSSGTATGSGGSPATGSSSSTTTGTGGASGVVNGCDPSSTTVSAGDVSISFPTTAAPAQYAPACVKVHEGSMVTWTGSFADHPLTPDGTGNPIMSTSTGTTVSFTFSAAGSFGFHCAAHPSSMLGAVFVVP